MTCHSNDIQTKRDECGEFVLITVFCDFVPHLKYEMASMA